MVAFVRVHTHTHKHTYESSLNIHSLSSSGFSQKSTLGLGFTGKGFIWVTMPGMTTRGVGK